MATGTTSGDDNTRSVRTGCPRVAAQAGPDTLDAEVGEAPAPGLSGLPAKALGQQPRRLLLPPRADTHRNL